MKRISLYFTLLLCCCIANYSYGQSNQPMPQGQAMSYQGQEGQNYGTNYSDPSFNTDSTYYRYGQNYGSSGSYSGNAYYGSSGSYGGCGSSGCGASEGSSSGNTCGDRSTGDCWCKYVRYTPQYYTTCHTEYEPKVSYQKCCRMIPHHYQKQCCRLVPQYYCVDCCSYCPEYYNVCHTSYCPRQVKECHCQYVPCYYWKHSCNPSCCE